MSAAEVEACLAPLPPDQRQALQDLRATLRTLLPGHAEGISPAMPGVRQPGPQGRMVAGYVAFARHLGLSPHSDPVIPQPGPEAEGFRTSKSGIPFTPAQRLPAPPVVRIVTLHQAEPAAR